MADSPTRGSSSTKPGAPGRRVIREVQKRSDSGSERPEAPATNPKAELFFEEAKKCEASSDLPGAERNLRLAVSFAPLESRFREDLKRVLKAQGKTP